MSLYPSESSTAALKVTIASCRGKKQRGEKITCLTAYDYPFARLLDESGVDILLVGDSWGMAVAGLDDTLAVTLEEMLIATRAVRRAVRRALVVADMPYGSYHLGTASAVASAIHLVKEGGAEAVKLEGGGGRAGIVRSIVEAEIPVMAHIGLTPQSVHRQSGYRVQGTSESAARRLLDDAHALEDAGAFAVVLEGIPRELAATISHRLTIPTIGIGAGPDCDGQVLVLHDLLGLSFRPKPKFVRPYADLASAVRNAAEAFRQDVENGGFPADRESYHLPAETSITML
ncbi:MAG TPA: 3-methyl-2-oxobutanoate hydroxymethyltransferase [Terriglobales bacterium]|nr:3-methyl-2-oxobutanoate hydroxymethyltransferase [Terriglobales bacterium]